MVPARFLLCKVIFLFVIRYFKTIFISYFHPFSPIHFSIHWWFRPEIIITIIIVICWMMIFSFYYSFYTNWNSVKKSFLFPPINLSILLFISHEHGYLFLSLCYNPLLSFILSLSCPRFGQLEHLSLVPVSFWHVPIIFGVLVYFLAPHDIYGLNFQVNHLYVIPLLW